jgi:transposase
VTEGASSQVELFVILDLHRQGLSVSAIARLFDLGRKTVRKYIERGIRGPPTHRRAIRCAPRATAPALSIIGRSTLRAHKEAKRQTQRVRNNVIRFLALNAPLECGEDIGEFARDV